MRHAGSSRVKLLDRPSLVTSRRPAGGPGTGRHPSRFGVRVMAATSRAQANRSASPWSRMT